MLTVLNYTIGEVIYESGNSLICRARRTSDNCSVILKTLRQDYPPPERIAKFKQEYQTAHSLNPGSKDGEGLSGVVATYGLEKHGPSFVIVMEDCGGESLDRWIKSAGINFQTNNGMADFLNLAIKLTEALAQIHQRQIIHKDINPSNIIFDAESGRVKIIDFGISTSLSRENPDFNNPNFLEGTLAYISPEQTGRMNRAVDYRTDFYSLGATFYELLTGRLPFPVEDALELVHCHIAKQPAPPHELTPAVPGIVSDIVLKLLSKDADDRYQSVRGILADLGNCLRQCQTAGHIEPFALGGQDISERFQIPQRLYGREGEIEKLLAAFERTVRGASEMMLVSGYAGIGKTVLVQEIYKPVTCRRGYFISGKFDQYQRNIPFSALIQAFHALIRQLLTESEAEVSAWREKLRAALGPNGGIILEVLPELELIIGPQPPVSALGSVEAQNLFRLVFQNFVRVFTQPEHPLVVFLDDLQWADAASLNLINLLLTAPDSHFLFFIGAYRDNEVSAYHPLMLTVEEIRKNDLTVNTISLAPLAMPDICRLTSDTLRSTPERTVPLAELLQDKTGGNPFFLMEFLKNLHDEGLIVFDFQQGWQWDLSRIRAQDITDNVVELIAGKTQQLLPETQQVMKTASCIGNTFDLNTLAMVREKLPGDTAADLWPAMAAGLVLPLGETYKLLTIKGEGLGKDVTVEYKFAHDRVQQAVYSLIPGEERQAIHFRVGQLLLKNTPLAERESRIFDIVNQLNQGRELIKDQALRHESAGLNLVAGKKAKTSTAYEGALRHLQAGMELLGKDGWDTWYDMSLALHMEAAEAACLNGDFEVMDRMSEAVLQHGRTLIDKVKVYEIKIQACIAQNKHFEAIQIALPVLKLLGEKIPAKPNKLHILFGLFKTKLVLAGKQIEDLIDLPAMTDPHKLAAMRIMTRIGSATYIAAPNLMPLITFKGIGLSIKYGSASESAFAYVSYGLILCGVIGDIESGYRFGRLAARLVELRDARDIKTRTLFAFNAFIRHWKESLQSTLTPLWEGYQGGLETGDLEFAARSINSFCSRSFFVGRPLKEVERAMTIHSEAVRNLKQESPLRFFDPFILMVGKLMGRSETPQLPAGEGLDNKHPDQYQGIDRVLAFYMCLSKLILSYLFEQFSQAVEDANEAELYSGGALASIHEPYLRFYDSLARLAVYDSSPRNIKKVILKKVAANQKKMAKWARHAPMNNLHKFHLVEAERTRVLGHNDGATGHYDKAVRLAQENDYLNDEALAHELSGKFYLSRGQTRIAQVYLYDARYAYLRWGAYAKIKDMEARYPQVLARKKTTPAAETLTAVTGRTIEQQDASTLDLTSVIKASQTISGEIVLNRLLSKLMDILIENAGAQRAFLVLEKNGKWVSDEEGAASIINYVAHTRETVVLTDATNDGPFTLDPYIVARQPKSVICMPLIHHGELCGILYLENNLTTNAFTPERLEVLRLLSGQMAISLINARLYDELELRVKNRTAELSESNTLLKQEIGQRERTEAELIRAKESAEEAHHIAEAANMAKSTFLANMSHEIRTPLNAIMGFTDLTLETDLSDKQRGYLQTIFTSSRHLLGVINDILDFSKIEAGKLDLDYTDFELYGLMDDLYSMFSESASKKGIKLNVSVSTDAPSALVGDPLRLWQVLINLINNAIKFTESGEVTIWVGPDTVDSHTARLRFSVRDTGIGIPGEALARIFDTFTQADGSMTRRFGGTGLGLSICKRLVEMMGGEIWVESSPGCGSTFYFTAVFKRRSEDKAVMKKVIIQPELSKNISGARALLVEDNIINQQVAKEILQGAGLVVEVVNNGREAVDAVRTRNYDVVLMDVQMPVMSGYEATRLIRGDPRHANLPIIAMTAHVMQDARKESLAAGMNDYIAKPIDRKALFSVLARWIRPESPREKKGDEKVNEKTENKAIETVLPDSLPGIDIPSALKRLGGNRKLLLRLLNVFSRDYTGMTEAIRTALRDNDMEKAVRLAHTVKGVAGNISAIDLCSAASRLEKGIRQQIPDGPDGFLETFDLALRKVLEAIGRLESPPVEETVTAFKRDTSSELKHERPLELREAITQLERESMPLWELTRQRVIFDEMGSFGQHIKTIGRKYGLNPLEKFGDDLITHVKNFDVENINRLLNSFPGLVNKIKCL